MQHAHVHEHDDHPAHLHWHDHGPHCDVLVHAHAYGARVVLLNAQHGDGDYGDTPAPPHNDGHPTAGSDDHHSHPHAHVGAASSQHHHPAGNGSLLATRLHENTFHAEREDADGVTDVSIDDDEVL